MSYKRFRDDVPKEIVDHIYKRQDSNMRYVYRALFNNADKTVKEDFMPYYLSTEKYIPPYLLECAHYGMSTFIDLEQLKTAVATSKGELHDRTIGYAFGHTDYDKGIWWAPNSKTHVEYFLFDWEDNNPCDDFEIVD